MSVQAQLDAGNLAEAITLATADVKREPARPELRVTLSELMCFDGNLERAASLIDAAAKLYQKPAPGLALSRQLIAGETARQRWFREGVAPTLPQPSAQILTDSLQVIEELRAGRLAEAARLVLELSERSPLEASMTLTSGETQAGTGFRDLNDLTANIAELITMSGQYCWRPWSEFQSLKFEPVKTLRDLLWRPVQYALRDGAAGQAFIPCLYAGSAAAADDAIRLGQATDWQELGDGLMSGLGQRMFLVGETTAPLLEIAEIQFIG